MPRPISLLLVLVFLSLLALAGCAPSRPPPDTVSAVDLPRYAGTWYEIERFDHWFERGLVGVTANYTLRPDGRIAVLNSGYDKTLDGKLDTATATAWTVGPAKLKVRFFWPFAGDYWVLGLDDNYRWAVVGTPDRGYLWLLHREAQPPAGDVVTMKAIAEKAGFDLTGLSIVPQRVLAPVPVKQ
jgi:apolipoprotein D and lipocalin family protein